jgi:hypothetical protein
MEWEGLRIETTPDERGAGYEVLTSVSIGCMRLFMKMSERSGEGWSGERVAVFCTTTYLAVGRRAFATAWSVKGSVTTTRGLALINATRLTPRQRHTATFLVSTKSTHPTRRCGEPTCEDITHVFFIQSENELWKPTSDKQADSCQPTADNKMRAACCFASNNLPPNNDRNNRPRLSDA